MECTRVQLPDGSAAIVCGPRRKRKLCPCGSGRPTTLLCDWKVKGRKSGTCDAPICEACTYVPAPEKDLCPTHRAEWQARLDANARAA